MEQDLVSIVVPIYNVERFLRKCLKSLQKQNYENIEVIMVDDGSPDESFKICREFEKKDSRFKYIRQDNGGLASARNTGIHAAAGQYIVFVDSDDYIEKTAVYDMESLIRQYDADMVVAGYYADIENNGKLTKRISYHSESGVFRTKQEIAAKTIEMKKNAIIDTSCNKMYRLSLIKENNVYMPDGELYEDTEFVYRLLPYVKCMYVTDQCYYHYMQRNVKRITNSFNVSKFETLSKRMTTMMDYYDGGGIILNESQTSEIWFWIIRYSFSCLMDLYLKSCPYSKQEKKKRIRHILNDGNVTEAMKKVKSVSNPVHKVLFGIMKRKNVTLLYAFARILYFIRNDCKQIFFMIKQKGV